MMKKALLLIFLVVLSLLQAHAQMDEHEMQENESPSEGSGKMDKQTLPSDDEDGMGDETSGSGETKEKEESTERMTTTTTKLTVTEEEIEEEPEMTTTAAVVKIVEKKVEKDEKSVVTLVENNKDSEKDETPDVTSSPATKFPQAEEEDNPDVNVDLEEDIDDDVDITAGNGAFLFGNSQFLAAIITGSCVGLILAIMLIILIAYRMRKKDEGSYALDDKSTPTSPSAYQYTQGQEYFA